MPNGNLAVDLMESSASTLGCSNWMRSLWRKISMRLRVRGRHEV